MSSTNDHPGPEHAEPNSQDSLARAAAAGPPITNDEDPNTTWSEAAEAHDTAAAGDEDLAENNRTTEGLTDDTEHPELSSIYGPPGRKQFKEDRY